MLFFIGLGAGILTFGVAELLVLALLSRKWLANEDDRQPAKNAKNLFDKSEPSAETFILPLACDR